MINFEFHVDAKTSMRMHFTVGIKDNAFCNVTLLMSLVYLADHHAVTPRLSPNHLTRTGAGHNL